MINTFFR